MSFNISTLGDHAKIKGGKRLPLGSTLTSNINSHPYIRVRDLNSTKTLELNNDFQYVDDATQKTISNYIVNSGDVIISIVGSIGLVSVIGKTLDNANLTENCAKIVELEGLDNQFLYYFLTSSYGQKEIAAGTVGAVQAKLPLKNIQSISIFLPSIFDQKAIAATLSCLDDKIELNNKINKTLEEMAQAIFKRWFVDFEFPDENGNPYKSSGGEMVESELGLIPKRWQASKLSDLVTVKYGKDHKKLNDGLVPVYGSGGVMRYGDKSLCITESILIPRKGTLNNIIYINEPFWSVDTMFFTEMKCNFIAKYFYLTMITKDLSSMNTGTAVPSMTTDILNSIPFLIPEDRIVEHFDISVSPLFLSKQHNDNETKKLVLIRDALLPKLMAGEIRVFMELEQ